MALVSVTRLRVRSVWQLPRFFRHAIPSNLQARKAPGNLGVDLLNDAHFTFWTKTVWKDEAAMRAYMLSGAHRSAMSAIQEMASEASVVHWQQESVVAPDWQEAHRRMVESGRATRLKYPTADHLAGEILPPRA
ncbi:MAG: hypothetical protein RL328_2818 [Acidobacteriota bacterium]|jgi:heme-degrading monooxygenase HmoA